MDGVAVASGSGKSVGEAFINALADAADGTVGVRKSYTAKGWHAQISKLTSSPRGYLAAEKAGLSVNHRTLVDWLAERRAPSRANQEKIARAYAIMAGRWPAEVEGRELSITGTIKTGDDSRTRTLNIETSVANWDRIKEAWESGDVDPDDFEEYLVEDIIEEDIGEGSDGWEFPGAAYRLTL